MTVRRSILFVGLTSVWLMTVFGTLHPTQGVLTAPDVLCVGSCILRNVLGYRGGLAGGRGGSHRNWNPPNLRWSLPQRIFIAGDRVQKLLGRDGVGDCQTWQTGVAATARIVTSSRCPLSSRFPLTAVATFDRTLQCFIWWSQVARFDPRFTDNRSSHLASFPTRSACPKESILLPPGNTPTPIPSCSGPNHDRLPSSFRSRVAGFRRELRRSTQTAILKMVTRRRWMP